MRGSPLLGLWILCTVLDLLLLLACIGVACVPTFASDRGHVLPVAADRFAALTAWRSAFIVAEAIPARSAGALAMIAMPVAGTASPIPMPSSISTALA